MFDIQISEILPLSMEHNFWTWSAQGKVAPIPVKRAKGVYFWDVDGKRYLDFNSMTMCVNIGHGDQRVIEAIVDAGARTALCRARHGDQTARHAGQAAQPRSPPGKLDHFLFTLGGADANENAIKLARAYTGRHKILSPLPLLSRRHGRRDGRYRRPAPGGLGADHHAGRGPFPRPVPLPLHFPPHQPGYLRSGVAQDYLNHLEEIIQYEGPETIAAILMEIGDRHERHHHPARRLPAGRARAVRPVWDPDDRR